MGLDGWCHHKRFTWNSQACGENVRSICDGAGLPPIQCGASKAQDACWPSVVLGFETIHVVLMARNRFAKSRRLSDDINPCVDAHAMYKRHSAMRSVAGMNSVETAMI